MRFNSNSLFRNIFLLMALISSLLLTACGGGGGGGGGGGKGVNEAMVGTWYLNFEDGKPVVPNSKGEVSYMILKSDGTCTMKDFDLTDYGHPTYWEITTSEGTDKGTWSYADGRLYVKIDGEEISVPVSLDNGKLTITWTYEDSKETYTSVYKKTKYGESQDSGGGSSQPVNPSNPLSDTEKALIGKWYLNYSDQFHILPDSEGNVFATEFKKDHTFTDYMPVYIDESESNRASFKLKTNIKTRNSLRLSSKYEIHTATGTWSLESGKLYLKYTDGNKKNDYEQVFSNVAVKNNTLTWTYSSNDGYSANEIFKKTKWTKPTEPASATKAIVGTWYLNSINGESVEQNTETERWEFKSDHTAKLPFEFTNGADKSSNQGTWYYDFGMIYIIPSWGNNNDELWIEIDFEKQSLIDHSWSYEEEEGKEIVNIYKKTNSTQPSTTTNKDLVGTWYLNYDDNKPVIPNSQGEVETLTLKSDGTCTWKEFDTTDYGHSSYWETEGTADIVSGKWSYSNGKLTTTIEGYTMSFPVTLKDGALTITGTYEGSTETYTSVYKKTKYSK